MLHKRLLLACGLVLALAPACGNDDDDDDDMVVNDDDDTTVAEDDDTAANDDDDMNDSLLLQDLFLNIAHRGGARIAPEDTLVSFERCLDVGADVLEMDIHSTIDGVVVVSHDASVDRTTDGEGLIKAMTFEELRSYDAGYWYTEDGGETYPYRGQEIKVPTLEEVFQTFPTAYKNIEIKQAEPDITDDLIALIEQYDQVPYALIVSSDAEPVQKVRATFPDIVSGFSLAEALEFYNLTEEQEAEYVPPAQILQVPREYGGLEIATPEVIAKVRRAGLKIQFWTINNAEEMRELIDLGADGIMTDDPILLEQVIEELGLEHP